VRVLGQLVGEGPEVGGHIDREIRDAARRERVDELAREGLAPFRNGGGPEKRKGDTE
jgi:hypothetical protein